MWLILTGEKYANFSNDFCLFRGLSQIDSPVERRLDRGQFWRDGTGPGDGDTREGFWDEEAVPGAEFPGAVGIGVADADGGVEKLRQLGYTRLGDHSWASGTICRDGAVVTVEVGALEAAQTGGTIPGAGAADGEETHVLRCTGDQFSIEAPAYEDCEPVVAERPHAGEHTAVPEGVDDRRGDIKADGSARLADVLVAEGGAETYGDHARESGNDGEDDALFQGVGGGHILSLPLRWGRHISAGRLRRYPQG